MRITIDDDWHGGTHFNCQCMRVRFNEWSRGFDCIGQHIGQGESLAPEGDASACDAADVQQIIDQVDYMRNLPVHDFHGSLQHLIGRGAQAQDLHPIANGRQGIAQFMRKDGEELTLAPVSLFQGCLNSHALEEFRGLARVKINHPQRLLRGTMRIAEMRR
jgi:hypothetical protein